MWVQSLGWEDPLEEGMATDSNILAQRIPWTEKPAGYRAGGHKESDTAEITEHVSTVYYIGLETNLLKIDGLCLPHCTLTLIPPLL